jgi:uncharacterized NAD(P)/FAD-binding protein YdhS
MSAFPDDPDHFVRWLKANVPAAAGDAPNAFTFAARRDYGRYLLSLLAPYLDDVHGCRLEIISAKAETLSTSPRGVEVRTNAGALIKADFGVLATGFDAQPQQEARCFSDPWNSRATAGLDPDAPVAILGTGLTMVDVVFTLRSSGHLGTIYAISRRGLMPQRHTPAVAVPLERDDIPFGKSLVATWRWLRALAERSLSVHGDWRGAIDAIRPYSAELWQRMPLESRRRFLRHARPWWDVHRHRMAPTVAEAIEALRVSSKLEIISAKIQTIEENERGAGVRFRRRSQSVVETLQVARIFLCTGVSPVPTTSSTSLVGHLLSSGVARLDDLGLGLEVSSDDAIVAAQGAVSDRLFAVGPVTRGRYWEMLAIPDIRMQCQRLARHIARLNIETDTSLVSHALAKERPIGPLWSWASQLFRRGALHE